MGIDRVARAGIDPIKAGTLNSNSRFGYINLKKGAIFVANEKRLYASDGQHLLEYRLRDDPNAPESLDNQQTSMGIVVLYRKLAAYSQHR